MIYTEQKVLPEEVVVFHNCKHCIAVYPNTSSVKYCTDTTGNTVKHNLMPLHAHYSNDNQGAFFHYLITQ